MQRLRNILATGGLALGLTTLAACGAGTETPTLAPVSTTAPTASVRPSTAPSTAASTAPSVAPSAAASVAPTAVVATRTTSPATTTSNATATRVATSSVATATRAGSPVASVTRTASAGTVLPPQAVTNLQQIGNSRQSWTFSGFTVAGLTGDLRPVFDYNGSNQKVTLSASGTNLEAYQVGGQLYVNAPIVGVVQADTNNPLTAPAQTLFATPQALLAALVPANVPYTPGPTEPINGRMTMRYTANVALNDLGFVDPTLAGQSGTAATTVWVDTAQGYLVALASNITSSTAGTTATARLDVTNVGQTPAITVPR